ncbi:hypothetical protein ACLB2K_019071 [Fragaria x ananassa]
MGRSLWGHYKTRVLKELVGFLKGKVKAHFDTGNYHREADVLRAVVQHFLGCHYVITAIVAHSRGGNAVILYGAKNRDVPIVVNISGRFNLERGIEGRLDAYIPNHKLYIVEGADHEFTLHQNELALNVVGLSSRKIVRRLKNEKSMLGDSLGDQTVDDLKQRIIEHDEL